MTPYPTYKTLCDRVANPKWLSILFFFIALLGSFHSAAAEEVEADSSPASCSLYPKAQYDVLIYGCTTAGIVAGIQVHRMNRKFALVCPEKHLGGMTTSGLGWTDSKHGSAIGGIAREFYGKIYSYYRSDDAWNRESRQQYKNHVSTAQPGPPIDEQQKVQWTFEPHVAEKILEDWMKAGKIEIHRSDPIDRSKGSVRVKNGQITSFATKSGKRWEASVFIDASYEGDLMATAGIPSRIGSEGQSDFGESLAGIQIQEKSSYWKLDPYVKKGDANSGLLPGIERVIPASHKKNGASDVGRLQPFNYRLSLTQQKNNQVRFFKPEGYKAEDHELLLRFIEASDHTEFFTKQLMPNLKTDTNSKYDVSTDLMGGNYNHENGTTYFDLSDEERLAVVQKHKIYTQGLFWTLANSPRVPKSIRDSVGSFGYAKDEWTENNNWPYELYIREGRRMKAAYTMTQADVQRPKKLDDSVVGLGSYTLDVHEVERLVIDNEVYNEGLVHTPIDKPFPIWYSSLVAEKGSISNFVNPITMGSTHVAFASIRMEPTYMIMAQSAATAAVHALEQCVAVQAVDRKKLSDRLKADNQKLSW
ncbi:hypothetical protein NLG97_g1870 [Lecanicillium saksenae]|uniref:Uncharacterized protein n=1 Tax=Lecanicillium saksenae TaxID=468837 RepID=A0ACC1R5Y5_9HYPO|nr:hypothetical protein NLG97_g1870 [Lecanicillium saksenae]